MLQLPSEQLERNAECNVAIPRGLREIWLLERAAGRIGTTLHGEQAVYAAVARSVWVVLETHFAKRSRGSFKRRNRVRATQSMRNLFGWVMRRRTTSDCRLRVTDEALVGVKNRTHACGVHQ
jgi:hypothetical protein